MNLIIKGKVAVIFTLDGDNKYYLECVESRSLEDIIEYWNPKKIIDESGKGWRNFISTKEELSNPTLVNGECFIVIEDMNSHVEV